MQILEERHATDITYFDSVKAFDKVPHRKLLEKLKSYNISGICVNWIEAFKKKKDK